MSNYDKATDTNLGCDGHMSTTYETREAWLNAAVSHLLPMVEAVPTQRDQVPEIRVSVGWPGGRGKKGSTIGQCWAPGASTDGVAEVFVSPVLGRTDPVAVLATLLHELCHAVDRCENGHRGRFKVLAAGVGLEGKMTATTPGERLRERLNDVAVVLGEFPHGAMLKGEQAHKPQTTRMLKVECANTGYLVRMTRKWLEEYGVPLCPCCNEPMMEG